VEEGKSLNLLTETGIFDQVIKMKYDVPNDQLEMFDQYFKNIDKIIKRIK
jgi:V/A-type H+-transporting ATPase subunit A